LADWESVRERLEQQFTLQRGHVTIAAMPSFAGNVLPRVLKGFSDQYPGVEVSVHDVIQERVLEMVESGRVEIGFGFEPEGSSLAFEPLLIDQFIAIVSPDSLLSRGRSVTWSQLLNQKFIALQRPSSTRSLLERSLAEKGLNLTVTLECHQLTTIGQFVAAGLGVSVVPAICRQQMADLGAVCLPVSRPKIRQPIGLITRADRQLSTAVRAVQSVVGEVLGAGISARERSAGKVP
jgi:LysR family carnitine catabolism transcriptional activator